MQSKDWNLIEIPWTWDIYLNSDLLSFSSQTWRNPGREIQMWIENKIVKRQIFKDYIGPSLCSRNSRTRQASDTKPRATCNYRGSLCCMLSSGKTAWRSLRPCKPRFCYREIPWTVTEPVLAGFSEFGLEATLGCRGRPNSERQEGKGSNRQPVVYPRRRSSRLVGERCLASYHSVLRLCRCRRGHRPFSLDPIRLHLCSLRAVTSSSRGGRCTEGGGRWSLPPSACLPPPGGPLPLVGC